MNPNRKLVTVKTINKIVPLRVKNGEPARSELAYIGGWRATVGKGEFHVGDRVVFAEPDSIFPTEERWSFLERYNYRIKTQKYNNLFDPDGEKIISQGLILSMDVLPDGRVYDIGDDVTALLGVTQKDEAEDDEFEGNAEFTNTKAKGRLQWVPCYSTLMRYGWFRKLSLPKKEPCGFVQEVGKTDEERIQNCGSIVNTDTTWTATEKVDGMSATYRLKKVRTPFLKRLTGKQNYDFAVCSRNRRLAQPDGSAQWAMARKYDVENVLKQLIGDEPWIAIQGECAGPKIQKNRQGLSENRLFVFNLITPKGRMKTVEAAALVMPLGLEWVPILAANLDLKGRSETELLEYANGHSVLNASKMREGVVFRAEKADCDLSFKAVSPEYLIKIEG
jgi:hypothetical protein